MKKTIDIKRLWIPLILFLFAGCATQSRQQVNTNYQAFYQPRGWQEPIRKKTEPVQTDINQPVVASETKPSPAYIPEKPVVQKTINTNEFEQMEGFASWYGPGFHGKLTANGEQYDQDGMTAAHKVLPMNTIVRVTNMENGRHVIVRINDRGPYKKDRVIDMSREGAARLNYLTQGTARVKIEVVKMPDSFNPKEGLKPYKQVVVQVGVFKSKNSATNYRTKLSNIYTQIPFAVNEHQFGVYHVFAGPYETRPKAMEIAKRLKSEGVDNFVRSFKK